MSKLIIPEHARDRPYGTRLWITEPQNVSTHNLRNLAYLADIEEKAKALDRLANAIDQYPELGAYLWIYWEGRWWAIPPGLVIDYHSVPRVFWVIFPPRNGITDGAALWHDFWCRFYALLGSTRASGDRLYREILKHYGSSSYRIKYPAVRIGGPFVDRGGNGLPGRKELAAMEEEGRDWKEYATKVMQAQEQARIYVNA